MSDKAPPAPEVVTDILRPPLLTAERLRELLSYDSESGEFRWRIPGGRKRAQGRAGSLMNKGYWQICVDRRKYLAHRLAWLYVHGVWPTVDLDHRNENKTDNRITNLREATPSQNNENRTTPRSDNTSGFLGVIWWKKRRKWRAQIKVRGRFRSLGVFDTPEEASEAYLAAKSELHPFWDGRAS